MLSEFLFYGQLVLLALAVCVIIWAAYCRYRYFVMKHNDGKMDIELARNHMILGDDTLGTDPLPPIDWGTRCFVTGKSFKDTVGMKYTRTFSAWVSADGQQIIQDRGNTNQEWAAIRKEWCM